METQKPCKTKTPKPLKIWNGRTHGFKYKRHHAYVAAYSMKQAAELLSKAFYGEDKPDLLSTNEIKVYYAKNAWGIRMDGIVATEPCVYLCDETDSKNKPFRVI
jgi:hypothetical protein